MKTKFTIFCLITLISTLYVSTVNAACRGNCQQNSGGFSVTPAAAFYEAPDESETEGLIKMREEEKLARDVYLFFYDMWNHPVFNNIAASEQRHMDSVKYLLDKYGITDPITDDTQGVFQDNEVQGLYDQFVQEGAVSIENAMMIGATIEDLDIYDLYLLIDETDNDDILMVYQNLAKGSRNHLRSFTSVLSTYNISYSAQYLTQEEVDQIISSPRERGRYDQNGQPMFGPGNGNRGMGQGMNFIDENNNGICDLIE